MTEAWVVVTGGSPYATGYDYNTSNMVRDAMPDEIVRDGKPTIKIFKYPDDIDCIYERARDMIPKIWETDPRTYRFPGTKPTPFHLDLVLHFGMRRRDHYRAFEKRARKNVFETPGLDGIPQGDGDVERWKGLPDVLYPDFDIDAAAAEVTTQHPDVPTRTSDDAGAYFCEYQLYTSLAYLRKKNEIGRVEFMHVPKENDEEAIRINVALAKTLICALIDQDIEGRFQSQL